MTENATATLTTYITDMHALVNHGLRTVDLQAPHIKPERHPGAVAAIKEIQRALRSQLPALDARAKALGGKTTQPIKDAVTTVTGLAAALVGAVRPEMASKAIRDAYTGLSHVAVGYLMLFTTAAGLGDRETATLAELGYRDTARLVMLIDRIMPTLVTEELREDGLSVADVAEETLAMVGKAWTREAGDADFGSSA
jgi:hypothetical protein